MDIPTDFSIQSFYGWWQLTVCLFAFMGLISIWYHIGRRQGDYGQIWLGLSILCWSLSGGLEVFYVAQNIRGVNPEHQLLLEGGRSVLSLLNSLFILLALPWFRYLPQILQPLIKSKYWNLIVGLPFVFSLLPTMTKIVSGHSPQMMSEPDVYYSILTLAILGLVLWESFQKRRLAWLAYLSVVCIMITFVAQLYKLSEAEVNQLLLAAIFKSTLIMIFFALALSWVKDLSEKLQLNIDQIHLYLTKEKNEKGRFDHGVHIKGIINDTFSKILLSPTQYNLLYLFVERKKEYGEGWLHIKPKSETRPAKAYDIKDYNEIKRLIQAMLDGLFGKNNWSKSQHEQPFKDAFFERADNKTGKIRLRIPVQNLKTSVKEKT